ncbi:MAG: hypothetical protein GY754_25075 [bacterium]|nr:hypothetical protein [bacterium]
MLSAHSAALFLTLASESAGMILFSLIISSYRKRVAGNGITALAVNAVTHTIFWYTFLLIPVDPADHHMALYGAELVIVLAEGTLYYLIRRIPLFRSLLLSLFLNIISFTIGIILLG